MSINDGLPHARPVRQWLDDRRSASATGPSASRSAPAASGCRTASTAPFRRSIPTPAIVTATLPIGDGPPASQSGEGVALGREPLRGFDREGGPRAPRRSGRSPSPASRSLRPSSTTIFWVATLASPDCPPGGTLHVGGENRARHDRSGDRLCLRIVVDPVDDERRPRRLPARRRAAGRRDRSRPRHLDPQPSDGGKTLTFHLRPGIRYSDGTPVRPEDFRFALERMFALEGGLSIYFTKIVGATACVEAPATCDLSDGVVADDAEGTVTFHLTKPDRRTALRARDAGSVRGPQGDPAPAIGSTLLPATGAYRITSYDPGQARFDRARAEPEVPRVVARRQARWISGRYRLEVRDVPGRSGHGHGARNSRLHVRNASALPAPGVADALPGSALRPSVAEHLGVLDQRHARALR